SRTRTGRSRTHTCPRWSGLSTRRGSCSSSEGDGPRDRPRAASALMTRERVKDAPYRIVTERAVVRCWEPRDAPLVKDAIDSSLDELREWMPWALNEPQTVEEKVELLRRFRGQFDLGEGFVYGIFSPDESEVVGGTGLHKRVGADAFEIGYWIRSS